MMVVATGFNAALRSEIGIKAYAVELVEGLEVFQCRVTQRNRNLYRNLLDCGH